VPDSRCGTGRGGPLRTTDFYRHAELTRRDEPEHREAVLAQEKKRGRPP
jgi:hypothetical protein